MGYVRVYRVTTAAVVSTVSTALFIFHFGLSKSYWYYIISFFCRVLSIRAVVVLSAIF